MSSLSISAMTAARVPFANSGLPVLDGWVAASKRRKSRLSCRSAGAIPWHW